VVLFVSGAQSLDRAVTFTPDANTSGLLSQGRHVTFSVPPSPTSRIPWAPSPESPTPSLPPRVTKWVKIKIPAVATRKSEQLTNTKSDPNNALGLSRPALLDMQTTAQWKGAVGDTEPDRRPGPSQPRTNQPAPKPKLVPPVPTQTLPRAPVFEHLQASVCKTTSVAPTERPGNILSQVQAMRTRCVISKPDTSASNPKKDPDQAKLAREGGVDFINMLLQAAMSTSKPVREWTFRDVLALPCDKKEKWLGPKGAYHKELEALRKRGVFGPLMDLPPGQKAIGNRWVHAKKSDGRYKAQFVAQGFSQIEGVDFNQVFSPVVQFETVCTLLALASLEDWHITGLNVHNTYLYGELDKEIYMHQPEGFKAKGQEHKVIRLNHALYGLKQAGLVWWCTLAKSMVEELGFEPVHSDAGMYVHKHSDG
jgi:hypothetical protein